MNCYQTLMASQLAENETCSIGCDTPTLRRFSCQLLNNNGQVTSARVYADNKGEAESMLNEACYKYANLSESADLIHPDQQKGIF